MGEETQDRWGGWVLQEDLTLVCNNYEVDLETCINSAEILDWITQVLHKTWVTPEIFKGLVQALDDLLMIQENFCPMGESKEVHASDITKIVSFSKKRGVLITKLINKQKDSLDGIFDKMGRLNNE
jgi:hypothetical protein